MSKLQEITVSFSAGIKANIGNYETASYNFSRTEKWDVSDLSEEQIDKFYWERFDSIKAQLDKRLEDSYSELTS